VRGCQLGYRELRRAVADGGQVDTSAAGTHTLTVTATDAAGNAFSITHGCTVTSTVSRRLSPMLRMTHLTGSAAAAPCRGRLTITARHGHKTIAIASAHYALRVGQKRKLTLRLSHPRQRLIIASRDHLSAVVMVTLRGSKPITRHLVLEVRLRRH
jgi:hypothetical protein